MADPRPVRIARRPTENRGGRGRSPEEIDRRAWDPEGDGATRSEPNTGGRSRGLRLFVFFAAGLAVIYVLFLALTATSSSPGVSKSLAIYGWLTLLTLALGLGGSWITVLRAPRAVAFGPESVVVTGPFGGRRRWPVAPELRIRVLRRYPESLLGPEATELVELSDGGGRRAQYLVGRGFFDRLDAPP